MIIFQALGRELFPTFRGGIGKTMHVFHLVHWFPLCQIASDLGYFGDSDGLCQFIRVAE